MEGTREKSTVVETYILPFPMQGRGYQLPHNFSHLSSLNNKLPIRAGAQRPNVSPE